MTKESKAKRTTNLHAMRFTDQLWAEMQAASWNAGTNVSDVTKAFYAWFTHQTDELPERPTRPDPGE